jgi:hypothetical protein
MIPFEEKDTRNLLTLYFDIESPFIKQQNKVLLQVQYQTLFNVNDIIHFKEADVRNVFGPYLFSHWLILCEFSTNQKS